jgi:hypothetical protein
MNDTDGCIMTFDEFLSVSKVSDLFQQVAEEIALEQKKPIVMYPEKQLEIP